MLLRPLLCLVLLGICAVARAEPTADELISHGIELRKQGKNAEALQEFQHAAQLAPSPRATAQIALAQQALGEWVDAETGLNAALAASEDAWIDRNRSPLTAARETVRSHLGSLKFESNLRELQLLVNGHDLGTIPITTVLRVPAGEVALEARAPGYLPAHESVTAGAGGEQRIVLALVPEREPNPPAQPETLATPSPAPVTPPISEPHWTAPSAPEPAAADSGAGRGMRTGAVVAFVAGGLALATGITAHVIREYHASRWNDGTFCKPPREQTCGGYKKTVETSQTVAIIGYAAAGGLLAGGLALWLAAPGGEPKHTPQAWTVVADPRGAAINWRTEF
jgi:hypothetical protein